MLLCMVILMCFCRFLNQISVRERYSNVTLNFVCDKRLYPKAKRKIARYHLHLTEEQPFTYTFRVISQQCIRDQHSWVSVFTCPQHSTFTRVQRISCGFAIVLSTMFANIMFYNVSDPAYDGLIFHDFRINLDTVAIGIESAVMIFPVNGLIMLIFRNVVVEEGAFVVHYGGYPDNGNIDVRYNTNNKKMYDAKTEDNDTDSMSCSDSSIASSSPSKGYLQSSIPRLALARLSSRHTSPSVNAITENIYSRNRNSNSTSNNNGNSKTNTNTYRNRNKINISSITRISNSNSSMTISDSPSSHCAPITDWCVLPWWCIYLGWTLTALTCLISSFVVVVYGLSNTHNKNMAWILSFFMATTGDICVIQPVKVAVLIMIMTLLLNRPITPTFEARKLQNLGKCILTAL